MSKRKTTEEFKKEVYDLVGDEYQVSGEYVNNSTKIKLLHTKCGKEFYVIPNNFLHGSKCPYCNKGGIPKKTSEQFKKEVYNLVGDEYKVLGEYINSKTKIKMLHTKCGNIYEVRPINFLSEVRCPFCCQSPTQIAIGYNSMWDTNSELAKLLLNSEDGYKYTQSSNVKVDWKCPECGHIINNVMINKVNKRGLSCPRCGDGISYPNRLMFSILTNLNINFETEKCFKWCKFGLNGKNYTGRYDFYFIYNNQKYIIEMDGYFHFNDNIMNGQTKEESNLIDIEKDRLARDHDIIPIRIDSQKSEFNYIKASVFNSKIYNIFNLCLIDWELCNRESVTSLKIKSCELWNSYHNVKKISETMKKSESTIRNWLNSCASFGMCDYNPLTNRRVFCFETNEIFNSITDASNKYNIMSSSISTCCKGKYKYAGKLPDGTKLHWRYID